MLSDKIMNFVVVVVVLFVLFCFVSDLTLTLKSVQGCPLGPNDNCLHFFCNCLNIGCACFRGKK